MFGSENVKSVSVSITGDQSAGTFPVWRATKAAEILSAYVVPHATLAAGTANYFSILLRNAGTAGTATTAIAGTVGGTAQAWTIGVPVSATLSEGTVAAGETIHAVYAETGTVAVGFNVQLNYVDGVGA